MHNKEHLRTYFTFVILKSIKQSNVIDKEQIIRYKTSAEPLSLLGSVYHKLYVYPVIFVKTMRNQHIISFHPNANIFIRLSSCVCAHKIYTTIEMFRLELAFL